jgi:hypothetical protein
MLGGILSCCCLASHFEFCSQDFHSVYSQQPWIYSVILNTIPSQLGIVQFAWHRLLRIPDSFANLPSKTIYDARGSKILVSQKFQKMMVEQNIIFCEFWTVFERFWAKLRSEAKVGQILSPVSWFGILTTLFSTFHSRFIPYADRVIP